MFFTYTLEDIYNVHVQYNFRPIPFMMLRNAHKSLDSDYLLYTCRIIVLVHVMIKCVESKTDDKVQCFKRDIWVIFYL